MPIKIESPNRETNHTPPEIIPGKTNPEGDVKSVAPHELRERKDADNREPRRGPTRRSTTTYLIVQSSTSLIEGCNHQITEKIVRRKSRRDLSLVAPHEMRWRRIAVNSGTPKGFNRLLNNILFDN